MNLHLRKYIKEFLNEITRGRTGQKITGHGKRSKEKERNRLSIDDQDDLEVQGEVGLPEINQSDIKEGREIPVIIGVMNDLDAKRDELGYIDEDTRPQKYFLGFCRKEFFDKYYDEALSKNEKEDWNETFSSDENIGMANWSKTIVNLDIKFVYVKLSDIYEEFDAGSIEFKYDEMREALKAELNSIKKEALKLQKTSKAKKAAKEFKAGEAKSSFIQLNAYRRKIYALENKIDKLKEDFKSEVERINNDPDIQGSLRDLKGIRRTSYVQGSGQRRASATTKEVLRIALQKYGLAFVASEIITAELLDEQRLINRLKSSFDTFRFYEGLAALGFTKTTGEEGAREKLKHAGLGIKDNIDQFAVANPEEADYYAAQGAEEDLDDYIKYKVIDDPEGRGLFGDADLGKIGSFAFEGYLKSIFENSKYFNEYIAKIPDTIDDPLLPDVKSFLTDDEKKQEAFEEFIEDLRSSSLQKAFVMFKTALCSIYKDIMRSPYSKDAHPISVEINVDSQGKITNLNDYDRAGACRTLQKDLNFKFVVLTMIVGRKAKEASLAKKGISTAPETGKQTRSMQGDMGVALPAYADLKYNAEPRLRRQGKSYVDTSMISSTSPTKKAKKNSSK
tara:strand:- start:1353 stop:3212 length:1860 start_codon:yes stop_codon:yes gene_type:complete